MALYHSTGRICDMSEVQSGKSLKGNDWQRLTLTLEIPGFQGSTTKQVFQVFGDRVDDVLVFSLNDKVDVTWSMYAREWNGRLYNNVDLVSIQAHGVSSPSKPAPAQEKHETIIVGGDGLPF